MNKIAIKVSVLLIILIAIAKLSSLNGVEKKPETNLQIDKEYEVGFSPTDGCGNFTRHNKSLNPPDNYLPLSKDLNSDYSCGTKYFYIGEETEDTGLANNLSYYAMGSEKKVRRIRILLNVNNVNSIEQSIDSFEKSSAALYQVSLGREMPEEIKEAILSQSDGVWLEQEYQVKLVKSIWPTGKGFSLNFIIGDPYFSRPI